MFTPILAFSLLASPPQAPIGVPAFTRVDLLPYLQPNVQTHEFTSYDRAGDNYDADYFPIYKEANGEYVLFDSYGPGCLYRLHMNIWNGDLGPINIRFYFDGETKPRIDMDVTKFFSTENPLGIFKEPLAHIGGGYRVVYHPFFYRQRLKVALSREPLGHEPGWDKLPWLGRYDQHPFRRNHWYEFTYHTYTENPGIQSWTSPADMSTVAAFWDPARIGKPARYGWGATGHLSTDLSAGGRSEDGWAGAGAISAIHVSLDNPTDVDALFDTWLTIRFDGAEKPQVEAPLGCFFGVYRHSPDKRIASRMIGCKGSDMYCYFPMPYWKGVVIVFANRGSHNLRGFHADIEHADVVYPRETCGTFHAIYHREAPRTEGHDYRYADLHGRGQLVGHLDYRLNTSMEEDERTYFDGSRTPAIIGEGFEDDHNQGWGLRDLQRAMWGSVASNGGDGAPWRFYIPEVYVFQSAVRAGHQVYGPHSPVGHEGMYQVGEEESVAFAYLQDEEGLKLTDELDVGNRESERAHHYHVSGSRQNTKGAWWYDGEENNVLFKLPPITDDGVSTDRGSEFALRLDPANRGVRLRRRTDKENNQQLARVYVDGKLVSERPWYCVDFERTFRDIRWLDSDFEIPARYTRRKRQIKVRVELVSSKTGRWDEFRYWAFCYR
ncbi:MAG: DUF2961 domain-containing protein [Fimbriimonadales bacterium]